jgi:prepilin-type N-terminal cleavage/methylation domain-containing protein
MKLKAFTLVEILITVLVLAILSSTGIALWSGAVDNARQRICAQNQYILDESLKMYIYDKDAVPVSLSSLVPGYSAIAIAKISKEKLLFKPIRNICLALINIDDGRQAWASFSDYTMGNRSILRCPAKKGEGLSYGYNAALNTLDPVSVYRLLKANDMPIICDSNNPTFSMDDEGNIAGADFRHTRIGGQSVAIVHTGRSAVSIIHGNPNPSAGHPIMGLRLPPQAASQATTATN